jgi:hypothetical protein
VPEEVVSFFDLSHRDETSRSRGEPKEVVFGLGYAVGQQRRSRSGKRKAP